LGYRNLQEKLENINYLAKTDSPIKVTGIPYSKAEIAVHFPVPERKFSDT
jgi:hypothetical protein